MADASPAPNVGETPWYEIVEAVAGHVFKIQTPNGQGTGFLVSTGPQMCAIATAAHVVNHAHFWEQPIRIEHSITGKTELLHQNERAIFLDPQRDTAAILLAKGKEIAFPDATLPLAPKDKYLRVGNELGWLGFPAVAPSTRCFFHGMISAWDEPNKQYFVDGVAINGVSGSPAFHKMGSSPLIVGVVSAYMPNRATGVALPGLSVVTDVSHFHDLAPTFDSIHQAKGQESKPVEAVEVPKSDGQEQQF